MDIIKTIGNGFFKYYKLALGHCGWSSGQLDYEISRNSWLVVNTDPKVIFENKPKRPNYNNFQASWLRY